MSQVPRSKIRNFGYAKTPDSWRETKYYPATTWTPDEGSRSLGVLKSLGYQTDSLLVSRGNPAPYGGRPQNGGDFLQKSYSYREEPARVSKLYFPWSGDNRWVNDNGYAFAANPVTTGQDLRTWSAIQALMVPMGSRGWNRFRPGKPIASLSQFIGELRELPKNPFRMAASMVRSMRATTSKARRADILRRSVGDHYLNWSFGWRPFLQDLEKIADFDDNLVATMRQLRRDNGQMIRRRGTIERGRSVSSSSETNGTPQGYFQPLADSGSGWSKRDVTTITTFRYWFSAGFVYHLPVDGGRFDLRRLREYLKGGGISPSVVWELTPWSWLADYYTSIGDVLENWEAARELNLAAKYAYVMYRSETMVLSQHTRYSRFLSNYECQLEASVTTRATTKARIGASAYGFGFTSGSLNNSQIANLVALGLSRRV